MSAALLLVNRSARRAGESGWLDAACAELSARYDVDVRSPEDAEATLALARDASARGVAVIVAGGDGTVGLVAHAVADARGTLGILPLGTANDLARELGLPRDPRLAARAAARGAVHRTDLVAVNGRRFITVGGLGLVSRSTERVVLLRTGRARGLARLAGAAVYQLAAARSMLERRITGGLRVTWRDPADGVERACALDAHGVFVTNHRTCGAGLVIPTGARADDGVFELALIPATNRARLLVNFGRLAAGLPVAAGVIEVLRADRAVIETEHEDVFVADGDALATGHRFVIESHPGAVGILR